MQFWHSIYIFFKYTTEINQLKKFLKSLVILVAKIMIFVCFYRFLVMKMTFFKSSFLVQVHQKIVLSSVQVHMVKIELSSVQKFTFWWTLNWTKKVQFNNTLKKTHRYIAFSTNNWKLEERNLHGLQHIAAD